MDRPSVAFSAPGKVLLAGGYLVLDRNYTGLVFGLDARIHVHVQTLETSPGLALSEIIVRSPQFRNAEWRYGYRELENDGGIGVTQLKGHFSLNLKPFPLTNATVISQTSHSDAVNKTSIRLMRGEPGRNTTSTQSRNKFVETALNYALTYASAVDHSRIGPASITVLADTDYYSHAGSSGTEIPAVPERFLDFNVPLHEAHKTGLGSSAALVTALTTAVVAHYTPGEVHGLGSSKQRSNLHNLAQAAHCAAQGKVGSGFDVAAATYGSCIYKRFSPSILEALSETGDKGFSAQLKSVVQNSDPARQWDTVVDQTFSASMPGSLRLLMCDVDCGSETVGMVKNVLSWKQKKPEEAIFLWETLHRANEDLAAELHELASKPANALNNYDNLRTIILTIRSLIQEMSSKAGVPIEPQVQTELIDSCCRLPGVVGGVVPGAGGYDAVALLVEDREEVVNSLNHLLDTYRVEAGGGPADSIGKVRLLRVKQEDEGVKAEDPVQYRSWLR